MGKQILTLHTYLKGAASYISISDTDSLVCYVAVDEDKPDSSHLIKQHQEYFDNSVYIKSSLLRK